MQLITVAAKFTDLNDFSLTSLFSVKRPPVSLYFHHVEDQNLQKSAFLKTTRSRELESYLGPLLFFVFVALSLLFLTLPPPSLLVSCWLGLGGVRLDGRRSSHTSDDSSP